MIDEEGVDGCAAKRPQDRHRLYGNLLRYDYPQTSSDLAQEAHNAGRAFVDDPALRDLLHSSRHRPCHGSSDSKVAALVDMLRSRAAAQSEDLQAGQHRFGLTEVLTFALRYPGYRPKHDCCRDRQLDQNC
jgi:hypothetical protein